MKKVKVGLLVEEFYDKDLGGYGGYGMIAREYIAKYIPDSEIEIEVIIGTNNKKEIKTIERDGVKINYLPKNWSSKLGIDFIYKNIASKFFKDKKFDIYLSIEMSKIALEVMKIEKTKKLILWIQDPRPNYDWEEIKSVPRSNEFDSYLNYYSKWENKIQDLLLKLDKENRLILISQGYFLEKKAKDLYKLPKDKKIQYFPNPVEIEKSFNIYEKKDSIIFLGRLTAVKRPWIYFELAKRNPKYIFYVCGQGKEIDDIIKKYENVKNLKFMGHVSGYKKDLLLKESKVLVNTSIHEAIPVSFLEGISYGCKILSCQNPDNITRDNGYFTGTILGEGLDKIEEFEKGLKECIEKYNERDLLEAIDKLKKNHSIIKFKKNMKNLIKTQSKKNER